MFGGQYYPANYDQGHWLFQSELIKVKVTDIKAKTYCL